MKELVIVGAGGFGRETALMVDQMQSWNLLGFYDDGLQKGTRVVNKEVLGNVRELNDIDKQIHVVVAIADPFIRRRVVQSLTNKQIIFPTLIHPKALIGHSDNIVGQGCIITAGVIMTTTIALGNFVIVNLSTTIGHDAVISEFTSIMPQCSISGNVTIGKNCLIGSGSRILQGLTIGDNSTIGAGAVVTKSFEPHSRIVGIPAERI